MLYVVGLGVSWKDLSLKGLEAIRNSEEVYLEGFTSLSDFSVKDLEKLAGKKITVLERSAVEEEQPFFENAKTKNVSLLIYGDPLSATTHFEIVQEAKKRKIKTELFHAPSIFTAVAETGLSLYRFGKVASIPFEREGFEPKSFVEIYKDNQKINAHTLFLLDLDPKNGKFLTIKEAISRLEKLLNKIPKILIGCARLGTSAQIIKADTPSELKKLDFGKAPYCLIFPAKLNFKEEEYLNA